MTEKDIIVKVRENKSNKQLIATIPRKEFKAGDNIRIEKVNLSDEELKLCLWIDEQKELYKIGKLNKDQIEKLESLPNWSWK